MPESAVSFDPRPPAKPAPSADGKSKNIHQQSDDPSPQLPVADDDVYCRRNSHLPIRPDPKSPPPLAQRGDYFANAPQLSSPKLWLHYLAPQAQYVGAQVLGKISYHILVEIKTVDLINSTVLGFLLIRGLITDQDMVTCFTGEIINNPWARAGGQPLQQYSFVAENPQWGLFFANDMEHWKHLIPEVAGGSDADVAERLQHLFAGDGYGSDVVFMRWKEQFLVPDLRLKLIAGALFDGFYYVSLSLGGDGRPPGTITGMYFSNKTLEKFQTLRLKYAGGGNDRQSYEFV